MIQPLHSGNALRLFLEPPAGSVAWRVLRKVSNTFSGHDDPSALIAYEGDESVFVEAAESLTNDQLWFYKPYYTTDGVTWAPGNGNSGTPKAIYADHTTDVLSHLRDRLASGLLVECQRGNFLPEMGYIQVYTAPPSIEQGLRFPLVTLELLGEESADRAIGESISGDVFDSIGFDWDESEGWLANVRIGIAGWSLNSDERIELRKAIRRIIVANLPVFESFGWIMPSISQNDDNFVNGEYPAQLYQVMTVFTCTAPVRVSGTVDAVREIIARSNP